VISLVKTEEYIPYSVSFALARTSSSAKEFQWGRRTQFS
jgi:hypothetical protein